MSSFLPLYQLLLRQQLTRGRLVLALFFSGTIVTLTIIIGRSNPDSIVADSLALFGLGFSIPILSLLLGSSVFGQLVEDETLVYLWLRPINRWVLAAAGWSAAATIAVPTAAVALGLGALLAESGTGKIAVAGALSGALAAVGYTGVFTLLGLVVRRALIWGLVYLLIWELFVARAGAGAARLSIQTYPTSVLSRMTDVAIPLAERSMAAGLIVPVAVAVVATGLTAWRLNNAKVA
ncbi:MAG: hypothetical protein ACK5RL_11685 [Acidimicrobiales bacterium]